MYFRFFFLVFFVFAGSAAASGWALYENARFGTMVEIPSDGFTRLPAPDNGDGQIWRANDTGEIIVWGSVWRAVDHYEGWEDYVEFLRGSLEKQGYEILYAPSDRRWFVLSGIREDTIVYLKGLHSSECPSVAHHVQLTYPESRKAEWGTIVSRIAKSLSFDHLRDDCP